MWSVTAWVVAASGMAMLATDHIVADVKVSGVETRTAREFWGDV